jgi:hypothetical protein
MYNAGEMPDKKPDRIGETKAPYGARRRAPRPKRAAPTWDFWNPPTLDEIIEAQGIQPLTKESFERPDFWPDDMDVEEFIALAKGERDPLP